MIWQIKGYPATKRRDFSVQWAYIGLNLTSKKFEFFEES